MRMMLKVSIPVEPGNAGIKDGRLRQITGDALDTLAGRTQVVDRDQVNILVSERGAEDVAADAPESVDANSYRHKLLVSVGPCADRQTANCNERACAGSIAMDILDFSLTH